MRRIKPVGITVRAKPTGILLARYHETRVQGNDKSSLWKMIQEYTQNDTKSVDKKFEDKVRDINTDLTASIITNELRKKPLEGEDFSRGNVGGERDKMFSSIIDSVLKPRRRSTTKPIHVKLQQFEKDKDVVDIDVKSGIKGQDLHWATMQNKLSFPDSSQKQKRLQQEEALSDTLETIENLSTDKQVVDFFTDLVKRFQAKKSNDPSPLSASIILEKCIVVLDTKFNEPSVALSLFELAKRSGLPFYYDVCSSEIYNKVIDIRWRYYRDIFMVESLLNEMKANAVASDKETSEVISSIIREVLDYGDISLSGISKGLLLDGEDLERVKAIRKQRQLMI